MERYWSIELCGWARSPGRPDPLATPWSRAERRPPAEPAPDLTALLPVQREAEGTRAEA